MRTPEMQMRHHASAVIARMLLICFRSMLEGYDRNKNIAAVLPELLVVMAIRVNDDRDREPMSASGIAKVTGLPRESVRRWLAMLVRHHVVSRSRDGYVGNDRYMEERMHAAYFTRVVRAIKAAARELEGIK